MLGSIRDYKAETIELQKELEKLIYEVNQASYLEKLQNIKSTLEKSKPSLMFYGIYNAGKSTLLNAIFGKDVASVNDIPETHKVTLYKWGEYTLADTPGLNGPPEDEVITKAEIGRHDIIMFVIDDSDNFDSDVITKKIIEILETKKPCIIVINRKNDSNKEVILAIKAKMNQNIQTLSSVAREFEFVDVDAKIALKAKKEEKQLLLAKSNIQELEHCISKKLTSIDSVQMLRVPLELMIELCSEIQNTLKNEIEDENSKSLYQLKKTLFQLKEQLRQEFEISLNRMIAQYEQEIYFQASTNRQENIREDVYEKQIQELIQTCMDKFLKEGNLVLDDFKNDCRMNLNLRDIPEMEKVEQFSVKKNEKDELDEVLDVLANLPILIPTPTPVPIPFPLVIGVLKTLKKWVFGSGNENVPDVEELNRQQEEYSQKREMALRELKNQISMQMASYKQNIVQSFTEQLEKIYSESITNIDSTLKGIEGKNQIRIQNQEKLVNLDGKANRLLKEILMANS